MLISDSGRDTDFDLKERGWLYDKFHSKHQVAAHDAAKAAEDSSLATYYQTKAGGSPGGADVAARFFDDFDLESANYHLPPTLYWLCLLGLAI